MPFTDVLQEDYFYDAVLWALQNEITEGTSETLFSPQQPCTRCEVVTFLWRAAGSPEPTLTTSPFGDISPDAYYYKAVLWAYENGITVGTGDGMFSPDKVVTRGESLTLIYRAKGAKTIIANPFKDVTAGSAFYDAILWAFANGVTTGMSDDTFGSDQSCLRAHIITFLYRAYKG
jgi:hypothetical protein